MENAEPRRTRSLKKKKRLSFSHVPLGQTSDYVSLIKGTMKLRLDEKFLRKPLRKYAFKTIVNDSPAIFLSSTYVGGLRRLLS